MVPRIVVPDDDDKATVVAALVQYTHTVSARAQLTGDFCHMIDELKITVGLLETLRDAVQEEIADHLSPSEEDWEKFQKGFGNDSGL